MKCIICGKEMNNNVCSNCGFVFLHEKTSVFAKIFKNKSIEESSDEINGVIDFLKFFYNLKYLNTYISRKSINEILVNQKENIDFFTKQVKSDDIKRYCKRYFFHPTNVTRYLDLYNHFYDYLSKMNKEYVQKKLLEEKEYFDTILKKCDPNIVLDEEQRIAILTSEDYNLVVAGAGAGKTTTVAGKVKYLIDKEGVKPEEILVVSFTNKAVTELKTKIINKLGLHCEDISTFHSIGRKIILKDKNNVLNKVLSENYFVINDYLTKTIVNDKDLLRKLILLFGYYLDLPEELVSQLVLDEYFDYNERKEFSSLKSNLEGINETIIDCRKKAKITINNEQLRSSQEVQIANFLYLNNIDYVYEKPYKYNIPNARKIYTPDFYIKQNCNECYIEHFGITENGSNNRYTQEELDKYIIEMNYKIHHHATFKTKLIKTFSAYNDGKELVDHLKEELLKQGFVLNPRPDLEVYNKILLYEKDKYVTKFSNLVSKFIHNFKAKDFHEEDFSTLKSKTKNPRSIIFLEIIERVYLYYQSYLRENNAVDFEDMINESSALLRQAASNKIMLPYKYIIVDEYQDISRQRFNLVQELLKVTNAKIMAVGDDWQSIYAFSGSEIALFTKFKEEMGYAEILKISKTYRNSQELIDIAGEFIQKNATQYKKTLKSDKSLRKPIVIFTYSDNINSNERKGIKGINYEKAKKLEEIISKIIQVDGINSNVLLIGRYGFDMSQMLDTGLFAKKFQGKEEKYYSVAYPQLLMTFLTAHSSKGLTYDNVIILNNLNGVYGFPAQIEDDPVLKFVTNNDQSYEFAEERRLFYVALTRTKNRVYILAPQTRPSRFVIELINDYPNVTLAKDNDISRDIIQIRKSRKYCPICGYPLQLKLNKTYGLRLYICTNEPEICDFMSNDLRGKGNIHLCDQCDGIMIVKRHKDMNKYFYGCTNYKNDKSGCNNIEEIEKY